MDRSDEETAGFERRTSRRISRQLSIQANADSNDSVTNDAYLAAMGISVSDGFRPSNSGQPTPDAANFDHCRSVSVSTQKPHECDRRPSTSASSSFVSSEPSTSTFEPSASSFSQPSQQLSSCANSVPETEDQETPSTSVPPQPLPTSQQLETAFRIRPSSIAKPPPSPLSLGGAALHNTAASGSRSVGGSGTSQRTAENVRESTASSIAPPPPQQDGPYQGPSGPSFPYQMYPQNVRMTSGTASPTTAQPDSSYAGPRGPSYPYGMYPQNTMAIPSTVPTATGIPVGFPGMTDNYRRRIGPDGDDIADLIGPDGHTEQLPPYTRYPDDVYTRKIAAANEAQQLDPMASGPVMAPSAGPAAGMFPNTVPIAIERISTVASASGPTQTPTSLPAHAPATASAPEPAAAVSAASIVPAVESIPGAGGIGLAPRNPEYDGAEDARSPRSHYSLRSFNSEGTGPEINTAARGVSEKRKPPNFIQRYGGRRILGVVPYWAICLVITAVLLMGIVLGAVVGTFVARHKRGQAHHGNPQSVTVTVDAIPIPTPSNLPLLPTGTFSLPLHKEECPGACFNDTTQAQAWSCNIPFQFGISMTIDSLTPTPDGPLYNFSINCNMSATMANNVYFYGEQAPVVTNPLSMQLVNDTLDPSRGPAWFNMMPYNKTVIVYESFLSAPASTPTGGPSNKERAAPASLAWGEGGDPFLRKGLAPAQAGDKPWVCTWPDTILEVFIYPYQNSSMIPMRPPPTYTPFNTPTTGSVVAAGALASGAAIGPTAGPTPVGATPTALLSPTQFPDMPPMPPPFPRVVKVEERRMAKSPQATCVQYHLKNEGNGLKAVPNLDAYGNTIEITIAEIESGPPLFSQSKRDAFGSEFYESDGEVFDKRDSSGLSKCGCLWMVT